MKAANDIHPDEEREAVLEKTSEQAEWLLEVTGAGCLVHCDEGTTTADPERNTAHSTFAGAV